MLKDYNGVHHDVAVGDTGSNICLGDDSVLLGYFGFLNATKGADTLITALSQLDDRHHLVFIGGQTGASDPDNNQTFLAGLRQQIERLGLGGRVHWTGFLSPGRVSAHLAAADLMVMPYRDGVSLRRGTLMAVLAHGRPLLTTAPVATAPAALAPELRHGENVWLVPPDDPDAGDGLPGQPVNEILGQDDARAVDDQVIPVLDAQRYVVQSQDRRDIQRPGQDGRERAGCSRCWDGYGKE